MTNTKKDVLGWRMKFGVLGPSTNTIVQPEFDDMRPVGVTNHYSRIQNGNPQAVSNESFLAGTQEIEALTFDAVRWAMNVDPGHLVMGMSAVTFNGVQKGADGFIARVQDVAGGKVGVSVGSHSTRDALRAYGGIKRIAFISPYWPAMNEIAAAYFEDAGFEVVRNTCLKCLSWTAIAEVSRETLIAELRSLDGDDVDAIVQIGTNLCMAQLAGEAEEWLGKPVIAINTATYWHALRTNGIEDKIQGFGRLLSEF